MKTPGPDHPIAIAPNGRRVRVLFEGREIAASDAALVLRESSYPPVLYIPRADADPAVLSRTERRTHCPYKGDASYFSIVGQDRTAENAVWSYEAPFPAGDDRGGLRRRGRGIRTRTEGQGSARRGRASPGCPRERRPLA